MNVLSLLILKQDVYVLNENDTLRQAVEKMSHHHYQNIPILSDAGKYINSVSAGDLLTCMAEREIDLRGAEEVPLKDVPIFRPIRPLKITATLNDIRLSLLDQNYVPLIDDQGVFFGIITRKSFATHAMKLIDE